MSRLIRRLKTQDASLFAALKRNAYAPFPAPVEDITERIKKVETDDAQSSYYGVFEQGTLIGGMRIHDFLLNYNGRFIPAGGIGDVAVDLLYKKKGTARDIINFFLDRCKKECQYLAMLYPFRPDFYYKMGFGYGTVVHRYSFQPKSLPNAGEREGIVYLDEEDLPLVGECYNTYAAKQHGFTKRGNYELESLLGNRYAKERRLIGYKKDGRLLGYIALNFKRAHKENFVKNDLHVVEWLWLNHEALLALSTFLYTQADQINRIFYSTGQPGFYLLLKDVRDGTDNLIPPLYHEMSAAGLGLMYRIVCVRDFLKATGYRNYGNVTTKLNLHVHDSLHPENEGTYHLEFKEGVLKESSNPLHGIDLEIDIPELSSLLMGSITASSLARMGKIDVDAESLSVLEKLFAGEPPQCVTPF